MSVYLDRIPDRAPVLVVLVVQAGCGACEEYEPVFEKIAAPYAKRGLPIIKLDAANPDANAQAFMDAHGVDGTPVVVAATLFRGPVDRIEGVATEVETRRLLDVAWAHNRPWSPW
jgi:thiol-disulfide isomerase/thioredoxin